MRRLASICLLLACVLLSGNVDAGTSHGIAPPPTIPANPTGSLVVGFDSDSYPFKNYMKAASSWSTAGAGILSADQYPICASTCPTGLNSSAPYPASYTGKFVLAWTGTLEVFSNNVEATVYSGGSFVTGCGGSSCYITNNMTFSGTNGLITLDFSIPVTGATSNGGLCHLTLSGNNRLVNGHFINVQNIGGVTGCTGRFAIQGLSGNTLDLTGSTFGGTYTSGGQLWPYDPQGLPGGLALWAQSQGPWSGVTNMAFCRQADYTNDPAGCTGWVNSGCQSATTPRVNCSINDDFIASLQGAKYGVLRFLDANVAVFGNAPSYANWSQTTNFNYFNTNWAPSAWAGSLSGTDTYTASCTSACSFSLVDGAAIQATVTNANLTNAPTLNVNSTGALPIAISFVKYGLSVAGTSLVAGDTVTLTLTSGNGGCLSGGSHNITYTLGAGETLSTIAANWTSAINADATTKNLPIGLLAQINAQPINLHFAYNNGCNITLSTSVTGTGNEVLSLGPLTVGALQAAHNYTFVYNSICGCYTYGSGGFGQAWPWAVQLAVCQAAKAACWLQIPVTWDTASVTSLATLVAANACRTCGGVFLEVGNEIWNFGGGGADTEFAYTLGFALGFKNGSFSSFKGLRYAQWWPIFQTAWAGGNGLHTVNSFDCCDGGTPTSILNYQLQGIELCGTTCSNPAYQNVIGVDYTSAPNRPQDVTTNATFAEYIGNILAGPDTSSYVGSGSYATFSCTSSAVSANLLTVSGTCTGKSVLPNEGITGCDGTYIVSNGSGSGGAGTYNLNNTSCSIASSTITGGEVLGLQYAADNWNGLNSNLGTQADALAWADYDLRSGTRNGNLGGYTLAGYAKTGGVFQTKGNIGSLNLPLVEYEGGIDAVYPSAGQATTMGLPSSAYGDAGGYVDNLIVGYKNSSTFKQFTIDAYNAVVADMPANSLPAKYDYEGNHPPWSVYPTDLCSTPYQDYNGAAAFNGGPGPPSPLCN